jgi:hypothetical protein
MPLLDPPHCPNCNSEIDLKALWRAAPKNRGMVLSDRVGIVCPVCGVKLRVTQGRVQVSTILVFVVPFALALLVNRIVPLGTGMPSAKIAWIILAAIYIGGFILQGRLSPRLLRLRFVAAGEEVAYPLVSLAREMEAESRAIADDPLNQPPTADDRQAWKCKDCGEENPGNFNECWKCLKLREAESISGSGTA